MNIEFVPVVMRQFVHFVYWCDNKKIPMNPNLRVQKAAKANDPDTWGTFTQVESVLNAGRGIGVGYFFDDDDPFVGIDIDHCVDLKTGQISILAHEFYKAFPNTYTEISMSGTGLHLIIQSHLPKAFIGTNSGGRKVEGVEFYQSKHYLALTGREFVPGSLRDPAFVPDDMFESFLRKFYPDCFDDEIETVIKPENGRSIFDSPDYQPEYDDDLIRWLCDKVPRFGQAFQYGSPIEFDNDESKRDFFVITQLLSLFHGDRDRAVAAFMKSACLRDVNRKVGHSDDYLARTFQNAFEKWNGFTYDVQISSKKTSLMSETPSKSQPQPITQPESVPDPQPSEQSDPYPVDKNSPDIPTVYNVPEVEEDYQNFGDENNDQYFQNTDRQNSKIFVTCNESEIRFCVDMFQHGAFFRWYGNIWKCLNSSVQCWNLIEHMFPIYRDMWLKSKSDTERKAIASARHRIEMASGVESCLSWVRADPRVQVRRNQFNQCRYKICFTNGVYDLESDSFDSADPADLFSLSTGYDFNSSAKSDLWVKTISEIIPDSDTRSSLQTFLGLCLSGDIDSEKFAYFYGLGGNGKGTVIRTIVEALGDFAAIIPIDLFVSNKLSFGGESATPQLAKLEYARLAVADEIPDETLLVNSKLKSLTGGDHITVRPLYSPPVTFTPQFKLILSGNVKAGFVGKKDVGIDRRLLFYPFEQTFSDTTANRALKRSLMSVHNLQGVINWLLDGFRRYKQIGLFESRKMKRAREDYLDDDIKIDPDVQNFVDNHCELDPNGRTPRAEFLATFRQYSPHSTLIDKAIIDFLFRLCPALRFVSYGGSKVIVGLRIKN